MIAVTGISIGVVLPNVGPLWDLGEAETPMSFGDPVTPFVPPAALIAPLPPVDSADLPHAIVEGVGESDDRGAAHWLSGVGLSVFSQTLADGATLLQKPYPRLPVRWSVTAAGGDVFGERLSIAPVALASDEAATADSATWFVNIASGEVTASSALLAPEGEPALTRLLSEALTRLQAEQPTADPHTQQPQSLNQGSRPTERTPERPPLGPMPAFSPPYDDLSFAPDGALIVTLPRPAALNSAHQASSAKSQTDPFITIRVRPDRVESLLSPAGQSIRSAVIGQAAAGAESASPDRLAPASPIRPIPLHPYPLAQGPTSTEATEFIGATPTEDVDCSQEACVALTFDDGPDPALTPRLLDILFRERVHATFFLQGDAAVKHPDLIVRALREGHTLGTHTWSHPRLPFLSAEAAHQEITRAKDVVISATGRTPVLMRPPYGEFSSRVLDTLRSTGDAVIMWNVDTEDWKNKSVPETTRRALAGSRPGSIILMHDVHPTSIQSVPGIIQGLRDRGFSLVAIPTLLGPVAPGEVYYGRS